MRGTMKRRRSTFSSPELVLQTDAQVGFIKGRHCIGCWSPNEPCPIDVRYAAEQLPHTSPDYPLCIRCNARAWERYGEQEAGA